MANTNAPFGLSQIGNNSGGAPTYGQNVRKIASGNTTAIGFGDLVMPVTGSATGYITRYSPGTVATAGVFVGCRYLSTSTGQIRFSKFWPGSDATGDVDAFVIDDIKSRFVIQTDSTGVTFAKVGQNATVVAGTVNTTTGNSGMYLNSSTATTATFPLRIISLVTEPSGAPGTEAGAYNWVVVEFNNVVGAAGATGIS